MYAVGAEKEFAALIAYAFVAKSGGEGAISVNPPVALKRNVAFGLKRTKPL